MSHKMGILDMFQSPPTRKYGFNIWVCLKIGYTLNYSHLVGIMIINHWDNDTPKFAFVIQGLLNVP